MLGWEIRHGVIEGGVRVTPTEQSDQVLTKDVDLGHPQARVSHSAYCRQTLPAQPPCS
jgi:hypothetical protein